MAMRIQDLYQFVLLLVLIGVLLGVGILVLYKFSTATGVAGTAAETAINDTINAITPISSTWLPIIVVVAVAAIILGLVLTSFTNRGG